MKVKKLTTLSLLTAVSLILFILELQAPNLIPIPGAKPGFANIVTIYCLYKYKPSETFLVLTARIILGALFSGNISALIYSVSGAFLCFIVSIFLVKFIPHKFMWLTSAAGAALHNTGQITAAYFVMHTAAVFGYFPYLLIAGIAAGVITGIIAQILVSKIKDLKLDGRKV